VFALIVIRLRAGNNPSPVIGELAYLIFLLTSVVGRYLL